MIDRSQFMEELKRNPMLAKRIAIIVNGEVGLRAPLETKILNAETIFNRAAARGQSLEVVTRQARDANNRPISYADGKGGYYPDTTFKHGADAVSKGNSLGQFYEQVLKPVVAGSDVSTQKLGFAATGNASNAPGNEVANNGIRTGYYTKYKWLDGPGGREVYVQHRPDNIAKLESARFNRPPGDIPNLDVASLPGGAKPAAFSQSTAGATVPPPAAPAGDQPWEPTNAQQQDLVAGITTPPAAAVAALGGVPSASPRTPLPQPRPASAPGNTLGDAIIAAMGPRGQGMSTYEDPTTHHQIMNPGGSGEQGMGLTRDLGLARPFLARPSQARPAPAPQSSAGPPAPPVARPAITPAEPVSREPYNISLDEGPTPSGAISPKPSSTGDVLGGMFDVKPIGQQRPLGDFKPQRAAWSPFETAPPDVLPAVTQTIATAPPEAAALAVPERTPPQMTPQQQADASRAFSSGGTPMNPYQPTTVTQQLNGTSPFNPPEPPPGSPFASNTLLPFQQWPPLGWGGEGFAGWGGPASFDFGAFG